MFVQRLFTALASGCLVALMAVVVVDVVGRNLLSRPLLGATEIEEILIGSIVFLGYPVLALRESHIMVDLVPAGPVVRRIQRGLAALIGFALFAVIGWRLWIQAERVARYGETTGVLGIPVWIVLTGISVLAAITALFFLWSIGRTLRNPAAANFN